MKIDYDLLRDILQQVADCENVDGLRASGLRRQDNISKSALMWHVKVLFDNGFVEGPHVDCNEGFCFSNMRFTLSGQEFFNSISCNKVWNAIKEKAKDIGMEITLEFIKQAVPSVLKSILL